MVEQHLHERRMRHNRGSTLGASPPPHLPPRPHGPVQVPGFGEPVHHRGERGGVGGDPLRLHLRPHGPRGLDPPRLAEDVEHGGVGEAVVLEAGEGPGPAEEEVGFRHGRVGLEHAVHGKGVPFDGEGAELRKGEVPGGVAEDGGDLVDGVAHVGGGGRRRGFWRGFFGAGLPGREGATVVEEGGGRHGWSSGGGEKWWWWWHWGRDEETARGRGNELTNKQKGPNLLPFYNLK